MDIHLCPMRFCLLLLPIFLCQCVRLPKPGEAPVVSSKVSAKEILTRSAQAHGDPWGKGHRVAVSYNGKWAPLVDRLQPELVDASFRKSSVETYEPRNNRVTQIHRGEAGTKQVERSAKKVTVTYNAKKQTDPIQDQASALVADAYKMFTYGSSWLNARGENLSTIAPAKLDRRTCYRVQGDLRPGLGFAKKDSFIAWIDVEDYTLRRVQFTLNGLESTIGADVEVTFGHFIKAPDGSQWPTHFVEWIERPLKIKAHEWKTEKLQVAGQDFYNP